MSHPVVILILKEHALDRRIFARATNGRIHTREPARVNAQPVERLQQRPAREGKGETATLKAP